MSSIHFAAGKVDAFDFFVEKELRLFDCVHRVAMQKTVHMAFGGCAVVLTRFIIL